MGATPIQWTNFSTNPIRARSGGFTGFGHYCVKISPGCKNCYSSRMQPRFGLPQFQEQRGDAKPELVLDPTVLGQVLRRKKPTKFFWCDMTDLFGEWVPNEWIAACFGVMAAMPQHTHQVLTKRARRMREWFEWVAKRGADGAAIFPGDTLYWRIHQMLNVSARKHGADVPSHHGGAWPLPNVHLGVSAEDQANLDERWAELRRCPAAVRWISAEPLLGPIDGRDAIRPRALVDGYREVQARFPTALPSPAHLGAPGVDWIVVGGESGRRARPFDLDWARSIVKQCREADTPVFVKQMGSAPMWDPDGEDWCKGPHTNADGSPRFADSHGGDPAEWPEDLRVREYPR